MNSEDYKRMESKANIRGISECHKKVRDYVMENMVKGNFKHNLTVPQPDLFGGESVPTPYKRPGYQSSYQRFKERHNYRLSTDQNRSCKRCKNCRKKVMSGKGYFKCAHIGCSNGPATDVRLKNVCDLFEDELDFLVKKP
jgi:hypothetical protein